MMRITAPGLILCAATLLGVANAQAPPNAPATPPADSAASPSPAESATPPATEKPATTNNKPENPPAAGDKPEAQNPPAADAKPEAQNPPAASDKPAAQSPPAAADKPDQNNAASPPAQANQPAAQAPAPPFTPHKPPTADDICRELEQDAAENGLPVEFFARVIWQESRFNAMAVSSKGARGIAQFMPATADYRGLIDPFDPIEALKNSASYLRDLKAQFGNLGLAAAGYNAGPGRVAAWLAGRRALPAETRNYVAIITGWTADDWASPKPPETSETTIPQGIPCTRLANLILAPKEQARRIAAYVPRWGMQLAASWTESTAWSIYRTIQKRYASVIGDREPIVIRSRGIGLGTAMRYNIRIGDDDRMFLEKFCNKLMAAGGACVVLRNDRG
jgi:soluble lytic murein transglycosylase-like protein